MDFTEPALLYKKAHQCEEAAAQLQRVWDRLQSRTATAFSGGWSGAAASSLNDATVDQLQFVTDAQQNLRAAAAALRAGAVSLTLAIIEEKRKQEELRRMAESAAKRQQEP